MKRLPPACLLACLLALPLLQGCRRNHPEEGGSVRTASVSAVVDGDTIWVNGDESVRYIGIDTPETGECFYEEARQRNLQLVAGRTVTLEVCAGSPQDKYGRTLAYVFVDGVLVNSILLLDGCARTLAIPPCTARAEEFARQQAQAQASGAGLWSACP